MRIIVALFTILIALAPARAADTYSSKDSLAVGEVVSVDSNPFAGFAVGVMGGAQYTDITISDGGQDVFSGISADGFTFGGHVGFNFCVGRICAGPYGKFAWSDVSVTLIGEDILTMDDYAQLGLQVGTLVGKSSYIGVHAGHEWQNWTAGGNLGLGEVEGDAAGWAVGADFETLVSTEVSFGISVDYVMLDDIEFGGKDLTRYLDDTDALRVELKLTYRPSFARTGLESLRF
jgi:hypothetical protein